MKQRVLFILLLTCLCLAALAQPPDDASRLSLLLGTWSGTATRGDGVSITTVLEIKFGGSFSGSAEVNGQPFWTFEGTWTLIGADLTWIYGKSSRPLPAEARVDTDELIALDDKTLVLKSKRTGRVNRFARVQR